jgi:hypothetical protein
VEKEVKHPRKKEEKENAAAPVLLGIRKSLEFRRKKKTSRLEFRRGSVRCVI